MEPIFGGILGLMRLNFLFVSIYGSDQPGPLICAAGRVGWLATKIVAGAVGAVGYATNFLGQTADPPDPAAFRTIPVLGRRVGSSVVSLGLVLLFLSFSIHAQINKCVDAKGHKTFSDALCPSNASSTEKIHPTQNSLDTSGMRQQTPVNRNSDQGTTQTNATPSTSNDEIAKKAPLTKGEAPSADVAYFDCISAVGRYSISEGRKANLISLCQRADRSMKENGLAKSNVDRCKADIEQTSASVGRKAEGVVKCYGVYIPPERVCNIVGNTAFCN